MSEPALPGLDRLAPTGRPAGDTGAASRAVLDRAARGFEAYFVGELLRRAGASSAGAGLLDGGQAGVMYRDLLQQEIARRATAGRGLGFADLIVRGVLRGQQQTGKAAGGER